MIQPLDLTALKANDRRPPQCLIEPSPDTVAPDTVTPDTILVVQDASLRNSAAA